VYSSVGYASITTSKYNSFSLNASGLANISKTDNSKFAARTNWDVDGSLSGSWEASKLARINASDGGYTGTAQDPKIDITYDVAGWAGGTINTVDSDSIGSLDSVAPASIFAINSIE
jgi:hypothetical protein